MVACYYAASKEGNMKTKTLQIDPERLARINSVPLKKGSHGEGPNGTCEVCVMEALAYITHQKHADRDICDSPIVESFLRSWNDAFPATEQGDADRDRLLKPLLPKMIAVRGGKKLENRRFWTEGRR